VAAVLQIRMNCTNFAPQFVRALIMPVGTSCIQDVLRLPVAA